MALILPNRYPGRFNPPSADYPQGSFKNRTTPTAKDGSYLEQDWANDKEGFFQSLLSAASVSANGNVDKVGASQYYSALVSVIAANGTKDYLNSARVDVPATAPNLTTGAPNSRHVRLTGSATITSFTVSANQCYFVTFGGAITLQNGSGIVTQTGANIVASSGDTCILYATANNVVQVMLYSPGIPQASGYAQTWQNLTASRVASTTYTNSTGRPITVSVTCFTNGAQNNIGIRVDGADVQRFISNNTTGGAGFTVYGIVPNGSTYAVDSIAPITLWKELR